MLHRQLLGAQRCSQHSWVFRVRLQKIEGYDVTVQGFYEFQHVGLVLSNSFVPLVFGPYRYASP